MNFSSFLEIPAETPFMAVDMSVVNNNIQRLQEISNIHGKKLRPHVKTHKIPLIANKQMNAGASGICVQKVSEAEVMFREGVKNILISNEVADIRKCDRVSSLSSRGCEISIAVDHIKAAEMQSKSASYYGVEIPFYIDVNVGMNRCGVDPGEAIHLYEKTELLKHLEFRGFMAYDGQVESRILKERSEQVKKEIYLIEKILENIPTENRGIVEITAGGTPSYEFWLDYPDLTEIQPGTYAYYDLRCRQQGLCKFQDIAMGVVAEAMSVHGKERTVLDVGYKGISIDHDHFPEVYDEDSMLCNVIAMSEEHTVIVPAKASKLGDRFVLVPYHSCTTTDLWNRAWIVNDNSIPYTTAVAARGMRE